MSDTGSTTDTGAIVIGGRLRLNPSYVAKAVDLLSNTTFWTSESFLAYDQPGVIYLVTTWVTAGR